MITRSTIKLLRIPFSFFLMPVFLFALSQSESIHWYKTVLIFIILHFFTYPASNGYNSYMDNDTESIGGIEKPPPPSKQLFYVSIFLDAIAIILSLLVSNLFFIGILVYLFISRAYSYRGIRLKKYPIIGFLTVFIFQGAFARVGGG